MRTIVLYIAMSLDGYIADGTGGVDWLKGQDPDAEELDTYSTFINGVDTIIMGWNTYHQVVTQLSPEQWPYEEQSCYVITHRDPAPVEGVYFTQEDPCALAQRLRREEGRDIWICGGAQLVQQLVEANLIDQYRITVMPTVLGGGIRLFGTATGERPLKLLRIEQGNGMIELIYERRGEHGHA